MYKKKWRMLVKCEDCPFHTKGPGLHLRKTLGVNRWKGILQALKDGNYFPCHQTTSASGRRDNLVCAGSLEYQDKNNYSSAYVRICRYIDKGGSDFGGSTQRDIQRKPGQATKRKKGS